MDFNQQFHKLLMTIGLGHMLSTAYDTAWVARLIDMDEDLGREALLWLREHQLPDGTWGASYPYYAHDRLICTLAAMTALGRWGDELDDSRLRRARLGIDTVVNGLRADPVGETVGFELIVPTLFKDAKKFNVMQREMNGKFHNVIYAKPHARPLEDGEENSSNRRSDDLKALSYRRKVKLHALPEGKINRFVTLAFSAEMVGEDLLNLLDIENLQESNGSVGHSPSATAHYALYVRPNDPAAMHYLRRTLDFHDDCGGVPNVAPFDVFERAWTLWNISLSGIPEGETLHLCQRHLDFLEKAWKPKIGIGFAADYTPKDSDDSSFIFNVLHRFGRNVDQEALFRYEEDQYFRCFKLESNPSISANIHMLGALRQAGFDAEHPSVQKIVTFLEKKRLLGLFWLDKWHASPYYPTTHLLIEALDYADTLIDNTLDWIIETQNTDGSWGYYLPTAEETAYCLQALLVRKQSGHAVPDGLVERGLDWLSKHSDPPYPPLWIGKCLYSPTLVVRSAILSALQLGLREKM